MAKRLAVMCAGVKGVKGISGDQIDIGRMRNENAL